MLHKTKAIVLNTVKYNDKYILVTTYTDKFGRLTYMVLNSKSKTARVQKTFFSPLALLELEVEHQGTREIQRIKEAQLVYQQISIATNMVKTSIVLFLSEFLSRVLKDNDEYEVIFEYLSHSIQVLEESEKGLANYHLVFMLKLTRFLGFYPNFENYNNGDYFDMLNGEFVSKQPLHKHYVNLADSKTLSLLSRISFENMHHFLFSRNDRLNIINRMLEYYRLHLHEFPNLKSLDILHEIF